MKSPVAIAWHWLLALILFACAFPAAASHQPLILNSAIGHYPVASELMVLEDPKRSLTIDDVTDPVMARRFEPAMPKITAAEVNFGYSGSAWWLCLQLQPESNSLRRWMLEVGYSSLDHIEVYVPRADGGFDKMVSGDTLPFSERPYPHRHHVFPVDLTPGKPQMVFLRVTSGGNLTIPVTLWQPDALARNDRADYTVLSLYYGMLLALGLYNLLLFLSTRDVTFLAYVAFTAGMAIALGTWNGLCNQFLWPDSATWGNLALPVGMAATGVFGAIFTRLFLDTRNAAPMIDRAIIGCAACFALIAVAPLLIPYRIVAIMVSLMGVVFPAVAVAAGINSLRRGHPGARYFLIAWTLLLLGAAVLGMRNLGWLPTTWLTFNAMQLGSTLELLLLSFALADRMNVMRREKEIATEMALKAKQQMVETLRKSEQELEFRVAERTQELEAANSQLINKEHELRRLALQDPLTGLSNRMFLNDRIERAITRSRRTGDSIALLLIDLDNFKPINDSYGHAVGDALLVTIASRIQEIVREADTVSRLGGDEFVILLEDLRETGNIETILGKLMAAVIEPMETGDGNTVSVSASIGVAFAPAHADQATQLLARADMEMYKAKSGGRNQYSIAAEQ
jgi:diguanylate cyclase (GGDEF)-like protein